MWKQKIKRDNMKLKNHHHFIKTIEKPICFILGEESVTILGVIRSLERAETPAVVLTSKENQIFSFSKYSKVIIAPHPKFKEHEFITFLLSVGKQTRNKGVLFPTSDVYLHVLLKNRSELEKYFEFPMAELDVVDKLLNKRKLYQIIKEHKIPHPKTYLLNDINKFHEIEKEISFPCIIKPAYSGYFRLDFNSKLFIAESKEELTKYYDKSISKNHEMVIQEIIPGNVSNKYGYNAYYDHNFNPHGTCMYRRIREWPHILGNGCLIQRVNIPELKEIITPLLKKIKYYGIIDAEFKKDPRDNTYKLIEINTRIWLQNSLPTRCGINLPYIAYRDTNGTNIKINNGTAKKIKWVNISEDIYSSINDIFNRNFSLDTWIQSQKGEKEYAILNWDDPLPSFVFFVHSLLFTFPNILIKKIKKQSLNDMKQTI